MSSPSERSLEQATTPPEATHAQNLSQQVFANPVDFLTTLKSILPKANPRDPDEVDKNDLIAYSVTGADAQGRAAASIAVAHFSQLTDLTNVTNANPNDPFYQTLSADKINDDINLVNKNVQGRTIESEALSAGATVAEAGVTAVLGAATMAAAPEAFPLAVGVGMATAAMAAVTGLSVGGMIKLPAQLQAKVSEAQTLYSWQGINGAPASPSK
jgi:hypothetical protein